MGIEIGPGLVQVSDPAALPPSALTVPLAFERQRLVRPRFIPDAGLKPLARAVHTDVLLAHAASGRLWTAHVFAPGESSADSLAGRAGRFEPVLLEFCRARFPVLFRRWVAPQTAAGRSDLDVLQVCMTAAGLWACVMPAAELSDPYPGGVHRRAFDPQAPSRSYLKIEEAFDLLGDEPVRGQTAIDLGAAPGGWTYAFLKRGCRVMAVDRGPLRLPPAVTGPDRLVHCREDGITFAPPRAWLPVDWLASDMLQPAGKNMAMLRPWLARRGMRRFIVNIKLPQQHPMAALGPLEAMLRAVPRLQFRVRQLYHDRREVTVFGRLT